MGRKPPGARASRPVSTLVTRAMSDALIGKRWRDDGITWVVRKVERITHEGWTYDCALYHDVAQAPCAVRAPHGAAHATRRRRRTRGTRSVRG